MSLVAYALRTTLQQALLGKTHAEDRVYDSLITPLEQLTDGGALPLIIISTDEDEGKLRYLNAKFEPNDRSSNLIIETTIASALVVEAGVAAVEVPHTDEGLEKVLDFMARRIWRAILDPVCPWADLFRGFFGEGRRYFVRRGADDSKGTLFAARQLMLICDPTLEPVHGEPVEPGSVWGRLITQMRDTELLRDYADLLAEEICGAPLEPWQVLQARLGLTRASYTALCHGPLEGLETTPPARELKIRVAGRPDLVVTEGSEP